MNDIETELKEIRERLDIISNSSEELHRLEKRLFEVDRKYKEIYVVRIDINAVAMA